MNDLESAIETEKGLYIVERKFKVMHYESKWPPYQQRESLLQMIKSVGLCQIF